MADTPVIDLDYSPAKRLSQPSRTVKRPTTRRSQLTAPGRVVSGRAVVAAVFGLVGVVLGGLLTGSTQWLLDWRRARRAVRRAMGLGEGQR
jgi:hypothetical protein